MAKTRDPLDLIETIGNETQNAIERLKAAESTLGLSEVVGEIHGTVLSLLLDLTDAVHRKLSQQEDINEDVEGLLEAEAERAADPSQLDPEDAETFALIIQEHLTLVQEMLAKTEDPKGVEQLKASAQRCEDALTRLDEIVLEVTLDADDDADDDAADVLPIDANADASADSPDAPETQQTQ